MRKSVQFLCILKQQVISYFWELLLLKQKLKKSTEEKVKCIVQQQCEYNRLKEGTNSLKLIYMMLPSCSATGL